MDNKFLYITGAFITGAAAGVGATWRFFKNKYEHIANEEIESVKERFSYKKEEVAPVQEDEPEPDIEHDISDYKEIVDTNEYSEMKGGTMTMDRPYVISPDDFDDNDEYDKETLTYYADNVLTDIMDERIENVDDLVGLESLTHFGEYEADSVYVRNDMLKTDYEICLDARNYSDVAGE